MYCVDTLTCETVTMTQKYYLLPYSISTFGTMAHANATGTKTVRKI